MKSSGEAKLLLILGLIVLLGGGALVYMNRMQNGPVAPPTPVATPVAMTQERFDKLFNSTRNIKGDPKAPISVIEFADFECPSCRRGYNRYLKTMLKEKPVRFAFRHYPLPMHKNALPAATAAEAAGKQGKFWEMYAALFEGEETELNDAYIQEQAKKIGLDMTKFNADRNAPGATAFVQEDKTAADEHMVDMTPTFFVRDKDGKFHTAVGGDQFGELYKKLFP